jgi:hypothetical protein
MVHEVTGETHVVNHYIINSHKREEKLWHVGICSATNEESVLSGFMGYLHAAASFFLQLLRLMQANHLHCIHYALHPYKC